MTMEIQTNGHEIRREKVIHRGGASEAVYGLGLIGAWFYYLGHATTLWLGVVGFFKGIFWPAMMVYELLKYLKM